MSVPTFLPLTTYREFSTQEMVSRARSFRDEMVRRRTVRQFSSRYEVATDGRKLKNYYVTESVGIATGMLISAVHFAGLVALTHTPSPMGFLNQILGRPLREKPFLILVVGYPDREACVPDISKKSSEESVTFV